MAEQEHQRSLNQLRMLLGFPPSLPTDPKSLPTPVTLPSPPLTPKEIEWCDAPCLYRYLRAYSWDVHKANKAIVETIQWRRDEKIDELVHTFDKLKPELEGGKMYVSVGCDGRGRPVIMNRKTKVRSPYVDLMLPALIYTMETAVLRMPRNQPPLASFLAGGSDPEDTIDPELNKWIWILDLRHWSRESSPPSHVTSGTIKILQKHYPERLFRVFIVDAPGLFSFFWSAVSIFVDEVTKRKVRFIKNKEGGGREELAEIIPPHRLEREYGGTLDYSYNFDQHEATMRQPVALF